MQTIENPMIADRPVIVYERPSNEYLVNIPKIPCYLDSEHESDVRINGIPYCSHCAREEGVELL